MQVWESAVTSSLVAALLLQNYNKESHPEMLFTITPRLEVSSGIVTGICLKHLKQTVFKLFPPQV